MLCMSFFNLRKLIKVIKQNKQIFELNISNICAKLCKALNATSVRIIAVM